MHILIMGGTFNPIHNGHLRGAEEVRESVKADKVLFIPAAIPPHKTDTDVTDASHRLEMARLAIKGNPAFEVSDIEIQRGGNSYTVDTLNELKAKYPADTIFTLILGSDAYNEITSWHEYEKIFSLASIIILPRPRQVPKKVEKLLPVELAQEFWYDDIKSAYKHPSGNVIFCLDSTTIDVSSSELRGMVLHGESIKYLVPAEVEEYISRNGLYK